MRPVLGLFDFPLVESLRIVQSLVLDLVDLLVQVLVPRVPLLLVLVVLRDLPRVVELLVEHFVLAVYVRQDGVVGRQVYFEGGRAVFVDHFLGRHVLLDQRRELQLLLLGLVASEVVVFFRLSPQVRLHGQVGRHVLLLQHALVLVHLLLQVLLELELLAVDLVPRNEVHFGLGDRRDLGAVGLVGRAQVDRVHRVEDGLRDRDVFGRVGFLAVNWETPFCKRS